MCRVSAKTLSIYNQRAFRKPSQQLDYFLFVLCVLECVISQNYIKRIGTVKLIVVILRELEQLSPEQKKNQLVIQFGCCVKCVKTKKLLLDIASPLWFCIREVVGSNLPMTILIYF
jgi:hypothetical protein